MSNCNLTNADYVFSDAGNVIIFSPDNIDLGSEIYQPYDDDIPDVSTYFGGLMDDPDSATLWSSGHLDGDTHVAAYLTSKYGEGTPLDAEPANEWVTMEVWADNDSWDPAGVSGTTPYKAMCIATGTPGTWIALYSADGTDFTLNPRTTSTYISTGDISIVDLYRGAMDNYNQVSDEVLTLPPAEGGIDCMFQIVDTSNNIIFRPPSGKYMYLIDYTSNHTLATNEGVSCPAANNTLLDRYSIQTAQVGGEWVYVFRWEFGVAGTGCVEETP